MFNPALLKQYLQTHKNVDTCFDFSICLKDHSIQSKLQFIQELLPILKSRRFYFLKGIKLPADLFDEEDERLQKILQKKISSSTLYKIIRSHGFKFRNIHFKDELNFCDLNLKHSDLNMSSFKKLRFNQSTYFPDKTKVNWAWDMQIVFITSEGKEVHTNLKALYEGVKEVHLQLQKKAKFKLKRGFFHDQRPTVQNAYEMIRYIQQYENRSSFRKFFTSRRTHEAFHIFLKNNSNKEFVKKTALKVNVQKVHMVPSVEETKSMKIVYNAPILSITLEEAQSILELYLKKPAVLKKEQDNLDTAIHFLKTQYPHILENYFQRAHERLEQVFEQGIFSNDFLNNDRNTHDLRKKNQDEIVAAYEMLAQNQKHEKYNDTIYKLYLQYLQYFAYRQKYFKNNNPLYLRCNVLEELFVRSGVVPNSQLLRDSSSKRKDFTGGIHALFDSRKINIENFRKNCRKRWAEISLKDFIRFQLIDADIAHLVMEKMHVHENESLEIQHQFQKQYYIAELLKRGNAGDIEKAIFELDGFHEAWPQTKLSAHIFMENLLELAKKEMIEDMHLKGDATSKIHTHFCSLLSFANNHLQAYADHRLQNNIKDLNELEKVICDSITVTQILNKMTVILSDGLPIPESLLKAFLEICIPESEDFTWKRRAALVWIGDDNSRSDLCRYLRLKESDTPMGILCQSVREFISGSQIKHLYSLKEYACSSPTKMQTLSTQSITGAIFQTKMLVSKLDTALALVFNCNELLPSAKENGRIKDLHPQLAVKKASDQFKYEALLALQQKWDTLKKEIKEATDYAQIQKIFNNDNKDGLRANLESIKMLIKSKKEAWFLGMETSFYSKIKAAIACLESVEAEWKNSLALTFEKSDNGLNQYSHEELKSFSNELTAKKILAKEEVSRALLPVFNYMREKVSEANSKSREGKLNVGLDSRLPGANEDEPFGCFRATKINCPGFLEHMLGENTAFKYEHVYNLQEAQHSFEKNLKLAGSYEAVLYAFDDFIDVLNNAKSDINKHGQASTIFRTRNFDFLITSALEKVSSLKEQFSTTWSELKDSATVLSKLSLSTLGMN